MSTAALAALIAPFSVETFRAEVFERRHLHLHRGASVLALGPEVLDYLVGSLDLTNTHPRRPPLRLLRGREELPLGGLVGEDGFADLSAVQSAWHAGSTLVLYHVERRLPELWALARDLSADLGGRVGVNLYLTPAGGQGLPPHYDDHDVIVLQVQGEKAWNLYAPRVSLPGWPHAGEPLGDPLEELLLRPGDLLYLPRGTGHQAQARSGPSLHLTLGLHPPTWAGVLGQRLAAGARDTLVLRRGVEADTEAEALAAGREILALPVPPFTTPPPPGWEQPPTLDLDQPLRRAEGVVCRLVRQGEAVALDRLSGTLRVPAAAEPALRHVLETGTFTPRDLPALDEGSRLLLARRLLEAGYVVRVEQGSAGASQRLGVTNSAGRGDP